MASAVESASTTANCTTATMEVVATARRYAMESGIAVGSTIKSARSRTAETRSAVEDGAAVPAVAVEAVEPRTRADKHTPGKIIRSVVPVGGTCVRGIPIVAICADRCRSNVGRTKLNGNLGVGCPCNNHEKTEQSSVF